MTRPLAMRRPGCRVAGPAALALALAIGSACGALAQAPVQVPAQPPAAAPTGVLADPVFQAAQKRYDALPDAERRAIQEALMWTGDFAGAGSGTYGPLTFRAIQAFQKRAGAPADGFLGPKERAVLEAAATKARAEVRFARLQDGKAGLQIGVPQGILGKVTPSRMGTRYTSPDGSVALETFSQQGIDLPTLFAQLTADQPGRKVTYKVLRPDFFVFTADQDGRRSYTRFAPGEAGLKGFVFSYPVAAAAAFDRVSVAIANSFEPGTGGVASSAFAAAGRPAPAPPPAGSPQVQPQVLPPVPTGAQPGQPFATGLVLVGGKVLTAAAVAGCGQISVAGIPARVERSDKRSGWALLTVPGIKVPATAVTLGSRPSDGAAVVVFGFAPGQGGPQGSGPGSEATLSASPGEIRSPAGSDQLRVLAALQTGGAGSPVLDRAGALVGIVGQVAQEPRLVAGIVPAASYPMIGPDALAGLGLAAAPPADPGASPALSGLGALAGRARDLVVAITCRP